MITSKASSSKGFTLFAVLAILLLVHQNLTTDLKPLLKEFKYTIDPESLNPSALDCQLDVEKDMIKKVGDWLLKDAPILSNVMLIDEEYHIFFFRRHTKLPWHSEGNWQCNSGDEKARPIPVTSRVLGSFIIKCSSNTMIETVFVQLDHGNTSINETYNVAPFRKCDELVRQESAILKKKEPIKIGLCTSIRGDNIRRVVDQWVEYHRLIGIQHFWLYVNEPWKKLKGLPQRPYITYIPAEPYCTCNYLDILEGSYWGHHVWYQQYPLFQTMFNDDCVYRGKQMGIEWITTPDVDEYIQVGANNSKIKVDISEPVLYNFLNEWNTNDRPTGGLVMSSVPFGRGSDPRPKKHPLLIDYVWRTKEYDSERPKVILHPKDVQYTDIHEIAVGDPVVHLDPETEIRINHYKNPQEGPFLPGDQIKDETIVVYRQAIIDRLVDKNISKNRVYSNN